jgi:hypothetical protein
LGPADPEPDPDWESGAGSRRAKIVPKKEEMKKFHDYLHMQSYAQITVPYLPYTVACMCGMWYRYPSPVVFKMTLNRFMLQICWRTVCVRSGPGFLVLVL